MTSEQYRVRFESLLEEVLSDYRTDCSELFGGDFNRLPQELSNLFLGKIECLESLLGPKDFAVMASQILLQTSDELWRDHILRLQGFVSNQMLAATNHKTSVAHYIRRSFEAWDGFHASVTDQFLSRLLTFPLNHTGSRPTGTIEVNEPIRVYEDVRTLMSDSTGNKAAIGKQSMAAAAD